MVSAPPAAIHVGDMSLQLPQLLWHHILPWRKTRGGICGLKLVFSPSVGFPEGHSISQPLQSYVLPESQHHQLVEMRTWLNWMWLEMLTVKHCAEGRQGHTPPHSPAYCFWWWNDDFLSLCAVHAQVFPSRSISYFYYRRIDIRIESKEVSTSAHPSIYSNVLFVTRTQ